MTTTNTQNTRRLTLRIRPEVWERVTGGLGLTATPARAKALGVSRVQLWRVETGQVAPGAELIAAIVEVFGERAFLGLFERVKREDVAA